MFKKKIVSLFFVGILITTAATQAYDWSEARAKILKNAQILKNKSINASHSIIKGLKIPAKILRILAMAGEVSAVSTMGVMYYQELENAIEIPFQATKVSSRLLIEALILHVQCWVALKILNMADDYLTARKMRIEECI